MTAAQNYHTAKKRCVLLVGHSPPGQGDSWLLAPTKCADANFLERDHLLERNAAEESFLTNLR